MIEYDDMLPAFLEGEGTDARGRSLHEIREMDDAWIENTHDFIQWVFPLDKPSRAVPSAPVLNLESISCIRRSPRARENLQQSADWFLGFLMRHRHWLVRKNHNHLRISRAIQSLRLLCGDVHAEAFRDIVIDLASDERETMSGVIRYWRGL